MHTAWIKQDTTAELLLDSHRKHKRFFRYLFACSFVFIFFVCLFLALYSYQYCKCLIPIRLLVKARITENESQINIAYTVMNNLMKSETKMIMGIQKVAFAPKISRYLIFDEDSLKSFMTLSSEANVKSQALNKVLYIVSSKLYAILLTVLQQL